MTRGGRPSSREAVIAVLEAQPDASAAAVASATGLGRSTVGKVLVQLENEGRVRRAPGERGDGRRTPNRWALITAPAFGTRLRPGQLDGVVLAFLSERAEPQTAAAAGKGTGRSSGAVANCLARLAAAGRVRQVGERPRRYVAA